MSAIGISRDRELDGSSVCGNVCQNCLIYHQAADSWSEKWDKGKGEPARHDNIQMTKYRRQMISQKQPEGMMYHLAKPMTNTVDFAPEKKVSHGLVL